MTREDYGFRGRSSLQQRIQMFDSMKHSSNANLISQHQHSPLSPKAPRAIPPPPSSSHPGRRKHRSRSPISNSSSSRLASNMMHKMNVYYNNMNTPSTVATSPSMNSSSVNDDGFDFDFNSPDYHFRSNVHANSAKSNSKYNYYHNTKRAEHRHSDHRHSDHHHPFHQDNERQHFTNKIKSPPPTSNKFVGSQRKSAIQDVLKKFQCPDTTSIPTTIMAMGNRNHFSKSSSGIGSSSNKKPNTIGGSTYAAYELRKTLSSSPTRRENRSAKYEQYDLDSGGIDKSHTHASAHANVHTQRSQHSDRYNDIAYDDNDDNEDDSHNVNNITSSDYIDKSSEIHELNMNIMYHEEEDGNDDHDKAYSRDHHHHYDHHESHDKSKSWSSILNLSSNHHSEERSNKHHHKTNKESSSSKSKSTSKKSGKRYNNPSPTKSKPMPSSSPLKDLFSSPIIKACQPKSNNHDKNDPYNYHRNQPATYMSSSSAASPNTSFLNLSGVSNACPFGSSDSKNVIISDAADKDFLAKMSKSRGFSSSRKSFHQSRNDHLNNNKDRDDDDSDIIETTSNSVGADGKTIKVIRTQSFPEKDIASLFRKKLERSQHLHHGATNDKRNNEYYDDEVDDDENNLEHYLDDEREIRLRRKYSRSRSPDERQHQQQQQQRTTISSNEVNNEKNSSENDLTHDERLATMNSVRKTIRFESKGADNEMKSLHNNQKDYRGHPLSSSSLVSSSQQHSSAPISSVRHSAGSRHSSSRHTSKSPTRHHDRSRSVSKSPRRSRGPNLLDQSMDVVQSNDSSPPVKSSKSNKIDTIPPSQDEDIISPKSTPRTSNKIMLENENMHPPSDKTPNLIEGKSLKAQDVVEGEESFQQKWKNSESKIKKMLEEEVSEWYRREAESKQFMVQIAKANQDKEKAEEAVATEKRLRSNLENEIKRLKLELEEKVDGETKSEVEQIRNELKSSTIKLEEQKALMMAEKQRHNDVEEELKTLLNKKNSVEASKVQSLQLELHEEVKMYKEQLKENDEYIKSLEAAMDEQINLWEQEEGNTQRELEAKSSAIVRFEKREKELQKQLNERKKQLVEAKTSLKETYDLKNAIVLEKKKNKELETAANMSEVRHQRLVDNLQRQNELLQDEISMLKSKIDESLLIEQDKEAQIFKLQEEIKHAKFRVQVLKTEVRECSPKRLRPSISDDNVDLNDSIAELKSQLSAAKQETLNATNAKDEVVKNMRSLESKLKQESESPICRGKQSSGLSTREKERLQEDVERLEIKLSASSKEKDQLQEEINRLEQKLFEARSRTRRIAIKSEGEMSIMRESQKASKVEVERLENRVYELEEQLKQLRSKHDEELGDRKRIENALRNELMILREDNTSSVDQLQLPREMKQQYVQTEAILPKLNSSMSLLLTTMDEMSSAKIRISKDIIKRMISHISKVKVTIAKLEVSIEEDKVQIESTIQKYDNSIKSHQAQHEELKNKLKLSSEELQKTREKQSEELKKVKQSELDILSRWNSLKGRYGQLQREFEEFKDKTANEKTRNQETEAWLLGEVNRLEREQSDSKLSPITNDNKKKIRMSFQHGISKEDIEIRLKEKNEASNETKDDNQFVRHALRREIENLNLQLQKSKDDVKTIQSYAKTLEVESKALKEERDRERKLRGLSVKHSYHNDGEELAQNVHVPSTNEVSTSTSTQDSFPLESIKEDESLTKSSSDSLMNQDSSEDWKQRFALSRSDASNSHISEEIVTSMVAFDEATSTSV